MRGPQRRREQLSASVELTGVSIEQWIGIGRDQLAREGRIQPMQPSWYTGYYPGWTYLALGNSMSSFETTANSALVSTPASSGGSGFSSGGGFSGGGGGGGGGGSW